MFATTLVDLISAGHPHLTLYRSPDAHRYNWYLERNTVFCTLGAVLIHHVLIDVVALQYCGSTLSNIDNAHCRYLGTRTTLDESIGSVISAARYVLLFRNRLNPSMLGT